VTIANFRNDVNANGVINSADGSLVKAHVGDSLPSLGDSSGSGKFK
jgi:hypothetical protein